MEQERKVHHIYFGARRSGKTRAQMQAMLNELVPGQMIELKDLEDVLLCDAQPLDPTAVRTAGWDKDRAICTIEMQDGAKYQYTAEAAHNAIADAGGWGETFEAIWGKHRGEHPSRFVHMYNFILSGVIPDIEQLDDPHEGMVRGYDGEWRWI